MLRAENDDFLPNHTTLLIVDVVNLVKDDEFDVANQVSTSVEHTTQNLGGHDQAGGFWIDLHITR